MPATGQPAAPESRMVGGTESARSNSGAAARLLRWNPSCEEAFLRHTCCQIAERRVIQAESRSRPFQLHQRTKTTEVAPPKELPSNPLWERRCFSRTQRHQLPGRSKLPTNP